MQQGAQRLSGRKRFAFNLLMLLGISVTVEVISLVILLINHGSLAILSQRRHLAIEQDPFHPGGSFESPMVTHPYIGAVLQPKDDGGELSIDGKYRITEFGFVDDDLPLHKRSPDRVIVGIVGGSVAKQFSLSGTEILADELSRSPGFAGKSFKFVRLASNGYKQPQQLMTINYVLSLGAEFDIVINLDGFNEAVLPGVDNIPFGVHSAYPRDWGKFVAAQTSPELIRMAGFISYLRQQQRDEARWADAFPSCYSPTTQLIWSIRNQQRNGTMSHQIESLSRMAQHGSAYCRSGPPEHFESKEKVYENCTEIWSRSSLLLHQLCEAKGIRYFHFLQPNQYLADSKPMGKEEASRTIHKGHRYGVAVPVCYPLMQAEGKRLAAAGVAFTDFTDVFADHPEPVYSDSCCHLITTGDLIIAKAMGERIRQLLAQ